MPKFPADWNVSPFGNYITAFKNGYGRRPIGIEDGPIVLRLADVAKGYVDLGDTRRVTMSQDEFETYRLRRDDLLFTRVNGSRDYVGQCIWIDKDYSDVAYNDHLIRVRLAEKLDGKFASMLFHDERIRANLLAYIPMASGGQLTINQTALEEIEIPVPPLAEQRKIAAILSTWDEAISLTGQLIAALQRRKQALMQLLLTGVVRFPEFKDSEWRTGEFINFIELQRGFDLPTGERKTGQYRVMASNGTVGWHDEAMVKGPGVVTGRSGTIGKVLYEEDDFWPLNTTLFVKDFKGNYPLYTYYFLKYFDLQRFSSGTGVPTLNRNYVHPVEIEYPSVEEQLKIAEVLATCDVEIASFEEYLDHLATQKHGLMQQLLTGALRVQVDKNE